MGCQRNAILSDVKLHKLLTPTLTWQSSQRQIREDVVEFCQHLHGLIPPSKQDTKLSLPKLSKQRRTDEGPKLEHTYKCICDGIKIALNENDGLGHNIRIEGLKRLYCSVCDQDYYEQCAHEDDAVRQKQH